jgi:hypothetical protein
MIIQKRTMNWLPRASVYQEAEANRLKRKENAQSAMAQGSNTSSLISGGTALTGESINLTLRIAAARVQTGVKPKV